jgi:hypothetical protein
LQVLLHARLARTFALFEPSRKAGAPRLKKQIGSVQTHTLNFAVQHKILAEVAFGSSA